MPPAKQNIKIEFNQKCKLILINLIKDKNNSINLNKDIYRIYRNVYRWNLLSFITIFTLFSQFDFKTCCVHLKLNLLTTLTIYDGSF